MLLATYFTRVSRVALFWIAFVLTRPFGATMGDILTKRHDQGGLDLGTLGSSAVLAGILVVLVARESWRERASRGGSARRVTAGVTAHPAQPARSRISR